MEIAVIVLLCVYVVFFIMGLLVNPPADEWMPAIFCEGGRLKYLGPIVWMLPVVFAPILFTVAAGWNAIQQIQTVVKWCAAHIFSQPAQQADLEENCNFEDSILSASDMPPLYEDVEFSLKSVHSASSSLY